MRVQNDWKKISVLAICLASSIALMSTGIYASDNLDGLGIKEDREAYTSPVVNGGDIASGDAADGLYVESNGDVLAVPEEQELIYRLYNVNSGEHFYTDKAAERNNLIKLGWNDEGIGWIAPKMSEVPVYRLYNPNAGDHHYTISASEKNALVTLGWNDEGIGWYSAEFHRMPVYREYNPNALSGAHNFTTSKEENDWLCKAGWRGEGISWYSIDPKERHLFYPIVNYRHNGVDEKDVCIYCGYETEGKRTSYFSQFTLIHTFVYSEESGDYVCKTCGKEYPYIKSLEDPELIKGMSDPPINLNNKNLLQDFEMNHVFYYDEPLNCFVASCPHCNPTPR